MDPWVGRNCSFREVCSGIEDARRQFMRCFLHACSGARALAALLRPLPRVTTVTRGLTPQRHAFTLSLVSHAHLLAPAPVCARASAPRLHCVYVDHSPRTTNRHVSPCAERAQTPHSDNAMKLAVLLISVLLLATGVEARTPSKECLTNECSGSRIRRVSDGVLFVNNGVLFSR